PAVEGQRDHLRGGRPDAGQVLEGPRRVAALDLLVAQLEHEVPGPAVRHDPAALLEGPVLQVDDPVEGLGGGHRGIGHRGNLPAAARIGRPGSWRWRTAPYPAPPWSGSGSSGFPTPGSPRCTTHWPVAAPSRRPTRSPPPTRTSAWPRSPTPGSPPWPR